ncbi:hypothetical protein ROV94_15935 [Stenotrophomonas maltophilia]|uniref:hypothetical protein n=1 Tax=Stenotrophomonas maltophilia TaxID=40324 RepID=UPI0028955E9C|nr:hypothetical protein [Stenotrophomonas maltophilia]MDT3432359.1 hypothetical protein [Stenotrophomonas maltophilia]
MIDELKSHWPLIQQYPWEFLWVFVLGVSTGLGIPSLWRKMFPSQDAKASKPSLSSRLWSSLKKRKFRPSEIQYRCVEVLRFYDHTEMTAKQVHQSLRGEFPLSDVDQALSQLADKGWASWEMNYYGDGLAYKLAGEGLDFARSKGMKVRPAGN